MAIIDKDTPLGFQLAPVSRQFDVSMFNAGGALTLHNDQAAAEAEGLDGPIAVGPQVAALIFRMMRSSFEAGWFVGGQSDLVFRRPLGSNAFATAKGYVHGKELTDEAGKIRVVCKVWVQSDTGEKVIVGTASGLVDA